MAKARGTRKYILEARVPFDYPCYMSARLTSGFVSFLSAAFLALSATTHAMLAPMPAIGAGLPAMPTPAVSAGLPGLATVSDYDAFVFADESGRFWLAVQVSPETHNRAIFYVQSPLGLAHGDFDYGVSVSIGFGFGRTAGKWDWSGRGVSPYTIERCCVVGVVG